MIHIIIYSNYYVNRMKTHFEKDIDNIIIKIQKLNDSIRNPIKDTNEIIKNKQPIQNTNYQLEQHKWKQQYLNYKRDLKKNIDNHNKPKYNNIESMEELNKFILENDYKKTWNRLDLFQKKYKLKQYIEELVENNLLLKDCKDELYINLVILLNKKSLKKVKYNQMTHKIETIPNIKLLENKNYKLI